MIVDLVRLSAGRFRTGFTIAPDDPLLDGYGSRIDEPIRLDVEVTSVTDGMYVMTVDVHGSSVGSCRRCLTPVEVVIDDRFRVVYQQFEDTDSDFEDVGIVPIDPKATEIEIGEQVRERLFLERNRFPLCDEECAGTCPQCGQNLNQRECGCKSEETDESWSALSALRFDDRVDV
jgi:uncharacterized protein